jgi:proteasome lid subunit RPN8/RPN11
MSHRAGGYGKAALANFARLLQDQKMLRLPFECQRYLREDVEGAYPDEACGILLGRRAETDDAVVQVVACGNVDPEPGRRYSIAPEELIATQKRAREQGMQILGFYHSHPDHPAEPSATDLREANWTGYVYLVCGVEKGRLAEIAAVRLAGPEQWAAEQVHFEPPE